MQDLRFNSNIYYFNNRIESTSDYVINKIGKNSGNLFIELNGITLEMEI